MSSAVRGSIRLPRCSLRSRPGVLYYGLMAPLVSSVKCPMDEWMDACIWVVYIHNYFNNVVGLMWGGGSLLCVLLTYSFQFEAV